MQSDYEEIIFKDKYKTITHNLDIDTHRWYETSISVIEIDNTLIGVRYITNIFSESSDYEDCYVVLNFNEMEKVTIESYKIK